MVTFLCFLLFQGVMPGAGRCLGRATTGGLVCDWTIFRGNGLLVNRSPSLSHGFEAECREKAGLDRERQEAVVEADISPSFPLSLPFRCGFSALSSLFFLLTNTTLRVSFLRSHGFSYVLGCRANVAELPPYLYKGVWGKEEERQRETKKISSGCMY